MKAFSKYTINFRIRPQRESINNQTKTNDCFRLSCTVYRLPSATHFFSFIFLHIDNNMGVLANQIADIFSPNDNVE